MHLTERHCEHCEERGPIHLVVRNPSLRDAQGHPRVGCWNTEMLTACSRTLPPIVFARPPQVERRHVTLRLDMTTCPECLAWATQHESEFRDDGRGHKVIR